MPVNELILVRHGLALPASEDPKQPLSDEGREQVMRTAGILASVVKQVDVIYHSSKSRTEETAELLATTLRVPGGVRWRGGLNPNDGVDTLLEELDGETPERVMIVGHLPFLSHLASRLLVGKVDPELVRFSLATAAALSRERKGWVLRWMIDPVLVEAPVAEL